MSCSKNENSDPEQATIIHGLTESLTQQLSRVSSPASSRSGSAGSVHPMVTTMPATAHPPLRGRLHHSIWECETTPMTTRPHFDRYDHNNGGGGSSSIRSISPVRPIRRIRSRSLGSYALERREHWHRLEQGPLLLPLMDWDVYDLRRAKSGRTLESPLLLHPPTQQSTSPADETTPILLHKQSSSLYQPQEGSSPDVSQVVFQDAAQLFQNAEQDEDSICKDGMLGTKRGGAETTQHADLPACITVLYGMINAIIVLPVLMSFGSIIYRDDAFAPYIPVLIKLTLVSGIVHQLCFSTFSSLPFAVGQVQDAGLIFLSSMASDMVQSCRLQHHDEPDSDAIMLATVTVGLALATALLGCGLVMIGYLNLGQYVQLLPTWYVLLVMRARL